MVWCSHLFQNFPQFIVIHTVKGFGIVNKAEIDDGIWQLASSSRKHSMLVSAPDNCLLTNNDFGGGGVVAKSYPTLAIPWTEEPGSLQSVGFSRQEHWSGLPFPSPGGLPNPGIEP